MSAIQSLDRRLSISLKGRLSEAELQARHKSTMQSMQAKAAGFSEATVLSPEQEEVQMGLDLAHDAANNLGYGLKYAYSDRTLLAGGSSVVFTNGTGLFAVVQLKYLPEFRDDRKSRSVRHKKLGRVKEVATAQAAWFHEAVAGKGTLVWAAVLSNVEGLRWVEKPSLPADLDEVELIPAIKSWVQDVPTEPAIDSLPDKATGSGSTGATGWLAGAAAVAALAMAALVRIVAGRK